MQDVIYLAIIVGFFLIAYGLVIGCDRIIGGHQLHAVESTGNESTDAGDKTQGRAS